MLSEDQLRNIPVLILANKQDLPGAANCTEITQAFEMHKMAGRDWYIQATCAPTGDGLIEGLQWVAKTIKKNRSKWALQKIAVSTFEIVKSLFMIYLKFITCDIWIPI